MSTPQPAGAQRTTRHCLLVDLDTDPAAIERYREWHRPGGPPAAITDSIRAAGIAEMEIFLSGNRLVMIMDTLPGFDPAAKAAADAADSAVQAWEQLMDAFQRPVPWAEPGQKWTAAHSIYRLSDQPDP